MRQIASEATTVRFRRIEVEGDAVLEVHRQKWLKPLIARGYLAKHPKAD